MSNRITGRVGIPELDEARMGGAGDPSFAFGRKFNMELATTGGQWHFDSLTSKDVIMEIHGVRGIDGAPTVDARTSWDGVSDDVLKFRNRNYAANGGYGAIRAGIFQAQNRSGGTLVWMRGLDVEGDNRGEVTDNVIGLRVSLRNNATVGGDCVGVQVEMLSQGACTGDDIALDLIHNDASSVASEPIGINFKASRATNGFQFGIRTEQYGIDKKGAASAESALLKLFDDSENADLASAVGGAATGVFKIVIGTTVGYVPMYASYTAA